jgi:hypothetical protein
MRDELISKEKISVQCQIEKAKNTTRDVGKSRPAGSPHFMHLVVLEEVYITTSVMQETKECIIR